MTITLPDEWRDELERKAKASGFATIDEYIAELVHPDSPPATPSPEDLGFGSEAELELKLLTSLDSGPSVEATPEFWASVRQRVTEQTARKGQP
jgi:hypothetical protein